MWVVMFTDIAFFLEYDTKIINMKRGEFFINKSTLVWTSYEGNSYHEMFSM